MADRYQRLFSLPKNIYAPGAPVMIAAGALLKDTQTGRVLAQLKLQCVSKKSIKAVKVLVSPLDTVNKPLGGDVLHEYLDLYIRRDEEFGQKSPIFFANPSTRAFSVLVTDVAFVDNSVWTAAGMPWVSLPNPEAISDTELSRQFQLHFGEQAHYKPVQGHGYWLCSCGALNGEEETTCHICGNQLSELLSCDWKALKAEAEQRMAKERAAREAEAIAAEIKAKKNKKILSIIALAAAFCLCVTLLITKILIPNSHYNEAKALLNAGQYDQAIAIFEALGSHKDSALQVEAALTAKKEAANAAAYDAAEALLAAGDYDKAMDSFRLLGDYRDSALKVSEAADALQKKKNAESYDRAEGLLSEGDYEGAITIFLGLGDYRDSSERAAAAAETSRALNYKKATQLLIEGDYDLAIELFNALGTYSDSRQMVIEANYLKALSLMDTEQYKDAASIFYSLGDYKESTSYAKEAEIKYYKSYLPTVSVGNTLFFGHYKENRQSEAIPIEWIVLAKENGRLLVLSKYALVGKQYDSSGKGEITWADCTLRRWLNNTFILQAFSEIEANMIPTVYVGADLNPNPYQRRRSPGISTQDKIFLFSTKEYEQYLKYGASMHKYEKCQVSDYNYLNFPQEDGYCWWWLRTPGQYAYGNEKVTPTGGTVDGVIDEVAGVRPAMWININP